MTFLLTDTSNLTHNYFMMKFPDRFTEKKLLDHVEKFIAFHGMNKAEFGIKVSNTNKLYYRIKNFKSHQITTTTIKNIYDFMESYNPEMHIK